VRAGCWGTADWLAGPSRGAIMTGKYPYKLGLSHGFIAAGAPYGLPLSERTLAQEMTAHGWSAHMVCREQAT
jgi:arylsulfatase A-like enzyme